MTASMTGIIGFILHQGFFYSKTTASVREQGGVAPSACEESVFILINLTIKQSCEFSGPL
jgi:hypothetical protein